ncbi:MAG: molybdopterin-dependent oxidoreductase, partial [Candidatus Heimdallarchaeota archaeon]
AAVYVAEILEKFSPSKIAIYLSNFLTDEATYVFKKFAELMEIPNVFTTPEELASINKKDIKVLYTTEGLPNLDKYKSLEHIIYQEVFPNEGYDLADVILPAAAFTEEFGTFYTQRGPMPIQKVVKAPDLALEDWKIVCRIAQELDLSSLNYLDTDEIDQEIGRTHYKSEIRPIDEYYLKYRGTTLASKVPDFKILLEHRKDREKPW